MTESESFPYTFGIEEEFFLTHPKLKLYRAFRDRGDPQVKAMQSVVDWLIAATMPAG